MHPSPVKPAVRAAERHCLVLIPGTLCDARLFKRQVRALRQDWRVIVLDYRDLKDVDAWPMQALQALPERFSLAGFSLGGLWALELLRREPRRVQGLALIASNAEAGSRRGQRRSAALWRLWRSAGPDDVARQVKPDYFHYRSQRGQHARLVRDMARATKARAARSEFEWAAKRPSGLGLLAAFHEPLLIVSGARDRLCPRRLQQRMAQAQPLAEWVELPRCGHLVPLEKPAALTSVLSRWLTRTQTTPPARSFA
jgi:pimeloyl-ACP methyl ester carboxylesterase